MPRPSRRCGSTWGCREWLCAPLRTVWGGGHLSEERFFSPQAPFFQRLLLPLSRAASAAPMRQRSFTACAVRDSGNKSLWKKGSSRGKEPFFRKVFSPRTVRRGRHSHSRPPHVDPHLREGHDITWAEAGRMKGLYVWLKVKRLDIRGKFNSIDCSLFPGFWFSRICVR